jgi:hypothetical protein
MDGQFLQRRSKNILSDLSLEIQDLRESSWTVLGLSINWTTATQGEQGGSAPKIMTDGQG